MLRAAMARRWWAEVAWASAAAGGALLPFAPAVVGQRTLALRDSGWFFGSIRPLVVEALRAGRLPLWNPHEAGGKPLFAEGVHSVLHPVSLAGALLAPASIDFLILAYLALAALGAFALARTLEASPAAAAMAGWAFALSGFTVSMTGNLVFLAGLSSLPWLIAAARAAGAGRPFGPAATALATACAFFSGDAQVALVGLGIGLALAADAGGPRGAARALAGMVAGTLAAGVQLAATQEFLPRTFRSFPLPPAEKVAWALEPGRLLEWVVPGLVRGPLTELPRGASGRPLDLPFTESVYLGVPLLVAAALGASGRPAAPGQAGPGRRTCLLLALAALVLLWLALGHHLGARQALDGVPLWNKFRYAEKLMGPLTLCLAVLGALGVSAFAGGRLGRRWTAALAAALAAAVVALLGLWLAPQASGALAARWLGDGGAFLRGNLAAGLPHAVAGCVAALLADRLRAAPARAGALVTAVALAAAAAVPAGAYLGDPAARDVPPMRLAADGPAPRIVHPVPPRQPAAWGVPLRDTYARLYATLLLPSANVGARLDAMDAYCAFWPRRFSILKDSVKSEAPRRFRRFGVTHAVVPLDLEEADRALAAYATEGGELVERDERLGREVWAVPHRPWAFFAARAVAFGTPEEAHREVVALMARDDDATVVVEAPAPPPTAVGRVLRIERAAERVVVEAEAEGPALLVIQDAHWPGWRASLDGRPSELLIADLMMRAVPFPPGRHRLELVYDPPGVRRGLAISLVGAVLVVVLASLGWRGARARRDVLTTR